MKRSDVDAVGESLRRRKLSAEEVNNATERAWAELRPEANAVSEDILRDLQPVRRSNWIRSGYAGVSQGFAIEAIADDPSATTSEQLRQMLRTMLADRFKLKFHLEQQQSPGFGLLVAKGGLKLKEVTGDTESPYPDFSVRATVVKGRSTLDELARWLTTELATPVVNKTGLTGVYEYEFRRPALSSGQRGEAQAPGGPPSLADRIPSYSIALEEQFGLRMESAKVPFETLVIDQVEKAEPN